MVGSRDFFFFFCFLHPSRFSECVCAALIEAAAGANLKMFNAALK